LLQEVRDQAGDFVATGATGETFTSSTPYVAWRDMLRELSGLKWEDPPEVVVERLGELVSARAPSLQPWLPLIAVASDAEMAPTPQVADLGPEFVRPKLHEVVVAFLRATIRAPTLFAIEDAHLMDQASADLLSAIAVAEGGARPWLFVVCRRPTDTGFHAPAHPAVKRLVLEPLGEHDSVALAEAATEEAPIANHVLLEVVRRANGNPQLLLDLLDALATGRGELPESVEAAATVRIDSLPPQDRSFIRRVSVFGLAFHPRLVEEVLDADVPPPDQETWDRLAEIFEEEGGGFLRFRRAVIRDAAYAGLPFRTRRRLHAAVGHRMEREASSPEDLAGLLAMHFSLAGEYGKALGYASIAARRAQDIFANVESATHYERAIDAARRIGTPRTELLDLLEALGEVVWRARLFGQAKRVNSEARALARHDPVRLARLMMRRSMIEESTGRLSQALRWLTLARRLLAGVTTSEAMQVVAELDARYAAGLQAQGRNRETVTTASRAIEEGEAAGSAAAVAYGENMLGAALAVLGKPGAIEHWRKALSRFEDLGDLPGQAIVLINLGAGEYFEGRWSEAVGLYQRAAQVSERLGDPEVAANSKMNVAEVLVDQGYLPEAETLLREAFRVWRAAGDDYDLGFCLLQLGRVAGMSGRTEEALAYLDQGRRKYQAIGASGQLLEVDARDVECRLLAGDNGSALSRIRQIAARLEVGGGVNVLTPLLDRMRGYALAQLGRLDEATSAFEEGVSSARERRADHDVALSLQGLARVARRCGEPSAEIEAETGVIFERLGIVAVPIFPMSPSNRG
jgi:tetratricopeptide (TPR) repeat protein